MKTSILIAILWITISANAFSQKATTWIGGTPGMKNDWFCPYNWSTSSVPDEFSDVIIPDVSTNTFSSPIIPSGNIEVNSLIIHSNANLTILKEATLIVLTDGEALNKEKFKGEGLVFITRQTGSKNEMLAKTNF